MNERSMIFHRSVLFFLIIHSFIETGRGQNIIIVRDFRAIQEISAAKSFAGAWEAELGVKTILQKDISQLGEFDINSAISYKPFRFITLGLGYQLSDNRKRSGEYVVRHRLSGSINLETKVNRLKVEYRILYQNQDDELFQDHNENAARNILRNRIQLKYNLPDCKLTPFLYAEHYGQLDVPSGFGLKIKLAGGASFTLGGNHAIKIFYRLDQELNAEHPYIIHNVCMGYKFKI